MTRKELRDKGWILWESEQGQEIYTRGDPFSNNCIWFTRHLNSIRVEVAYNDTLLLEGWLMNDSVEELHFILKKIIWLK